MIDDVQTTHCCGVLQYERLNETPNVAHVIADYVAYEHDVVDHVKSEVRYGAQLLLMDVRDNNGDHYYPHVKQGEKFASYVQRHGLGRVASAPARKNPHSGAYIKVFTWVPSASGIKRWVANEMEKHAPDHHADLTDRIKRASRDRRAWWW